MKPGDGLLALLLEARLGACGHPRQPHPYRREVELPCATPGCPEGQLCDHLRVLEPLAPYVAPAPSFATKERMLERAEAYIDGDETPHPRIWLWRFR